MFRTRMRNDVEGIVDVIVDEDEGEQYYLVKWKGYYKPTWQPSSNLDNCQRLIKEFRKVNTFAR